MAQTFRNWDLEIGICLEIRSIRAIRNLIMNLAITGTIGLDDIETPFGKVAGTLGGSGVYAALAASHFVEPGLISVAGNDLSSQHSKILENIDTTGITKTGKTFHWSGFYEFDMNEAQTKQTDLNSLAGYKPVVPDNYKKAKYLFLANIDPEIQLEVLAQMESNVTAHSQRHSRAGGNPGSTDTTKLPGSPGTTLENTAGPEDDNDGMSEQIQSRPFVVLDTMNYWIENKKELLRKVIGKVDIVVMNEGEARQFCATPNLIKAGRKLLELGPSYIIIKKGEHGALLFGHNTFFSAPGYPLEEVKDPTGAGDSFAGGLIGYLAKTDDVSEQNIRKGIIYGSVIASFCAEEFGLKYLGKISQTEIDERYKVFEKIRKF